MMQRKVGNTLETYRQDEHGHLLEIVHSSWGLFTVETRDDRVHRKLKGFVEGHLALADLKPFMKYSRWFRGPHMDWNDLLYEGYLAQSNDTELEDDTALSAYFHECWKRSDYWSMAAFFSKGECLMKLGHLDEAAAIFTEGQERFPEHASQFNEFLKRTRAFALTGRPA